MLKLLTIALVVALVYWFFFKKSKTDSIEAQRDRKEVDDTMVPCEQCGIFVSSSDALLHNGHYFCSHECLEKV